MDSERRKSVLPRCSVKTLLLVCMLCCEGSAWSQLQPKKVWPKRKSEPQLVLQLGHSDPITSLAFSPDGKTILTAGEDTAAHLWDVSTGQEIRAFQGQLDPIWAGTFSRDGKKILTGSFGSKAHLWDAKSGKEIRSFDGQADIVYAVAFSPNGRQVLTGSDTARLWDLNTGREVRELNAHTGSILSAAYSPDGRLVATGGADKTARLWNSVKGEVVARLDGHAGSIWSVAFSSDGRFVATGSEDKTACIWDVISHQRVQCFGPHPGTVRTIAFSPNGKLLVTGNDDRARVWEVATGKEAITLAGSPGTFSSVAYSPDGRTIATSGPANSALLWDATTGKIIRSFQGYVSRVSSVAYAPDGRLVAIGREDTVSLWDPTTWKEVRRLNDEMGTVSSVAFSPDGRTLATGSSDMVARLWDVATGVEIQRFEGHSGPVYSVVFSPDSSFLATGSLDGTVRLWNPKDGSEIRKLDGKSDSVWSVSISPDGRFIAAGSNTLLLWRVETGEIVKQFAVPPGPIPVRSVAFSPDGTKVLSSGDIARLWDVTTGNEIQDFRGPANNEVQCVRFSQLGNTILTGNFDDESAQLWDVASGRALKRFEGHAGPVMSVAFSPDGRFILTGSWDGTARLWSPVEGQNKEICKIISLNNNDWIVVVPDGRFDTSSLEDLPGLNWVVPDDPFKALSLEIFMRDYYQPKILSALSRPSIRNGSKAEPIAHVRPIASLNPIQPSVKLVEIKEEAQGLVSVTVEVTQGRGSFIRNNKNITRVSGAYDLRLFRDNQLVAQWPASAISDQRGNEIPNESNGLLVWRRSNKIELGSKTGKWRHVFQHIRVPRLARDEVKFRAYAFNEDRVKSPTSVSLGYSARGLHTKTKPRAYVITVGVNANSSGLNLDFAVNSAEEVQQLMHQRLLDYEIIDVPLRSTLAPDRPCFAEKRATKAYLRAVFDLLSNRPIDPTMQRTLDPNNNIKPATPDDLVLVYISSHGYADASGNFYLLLADARLSDEDSDCPTGSGIGELLTDCLTHPVAECQKFLRHTISNSELADWWKPVDAGAMVMILDSCHSASVAERQFRPGPLGDRGFGQLSYDKGMIILTASQPDKTARATLLSGTGTSIMAETLISEGASNSPFALAEWLQETEVQVPIRFKRLYPDFKDDEVQYPTLFDFSKKKTKVPGAPIVAP